MKRIQANAPAISIFLLALLVRIVYNLTAAQDYVIKEDAALYNTIAQHLVSEHCFCLYAFHPTVSRAPLWPFIIASIYFFTGPHDIYVRLFYSLLGSATCVFVYLLARDLFGKRIALLTGVLASIYTGLFIYDGWLYAESLYTFCLTAFAYILYRLQKAPSPQPPDATSVTVTGMSRWRSWLQRTTRQRWLIFAGALLGMSALARPNGLSLFGLLCIWGGIVALAKILPWKTAIKDVLVIAIIAALLIAPWTYRNYTVTHTFVPVAIGMGDLLLGAYNDTVVQNNPIGRGLWVSRDHISNAPPGLIGHDAYSYTPENDKTDTTYALRWISTHWSAMPALLGLHFVNMWTPYTFEPDLPVITSPHLLASQIIWFMMLIMPIPIFLLAAFGLLATWKRRRKQLIVVYLILAFTILENVVFYGNMRFRAPIEPLLVLLVGGAVWWLITYKSKYRLKQKSPNEGRTGNLIPL